MIRSITSKFHKVCKPSRPILRSSALRFPTLIEKDKLPFAILRETDDWFAVNKPSDMKSVANKDLNEKDSLTYFAVRAFPELLARDIRFPNRTKSNPYQYGAVHRLDRNTSGVMLLAKTQFALRHLIEQLSPQGKAIKYYWTLVYGEAPLQGVSQQDIWIPRGRVNGQYKVFGEDELHTIRTPDVTRFAAKTEFERLDIFTFLQRPISLLRCRIHTGRTHQIRFHLRNLGFPLLGEQKYTLPDFTPIRNLETPIKNQALHARSLEFRCPSYGRITQVEAPLGPGFENVLGYLRAQKYGADEEAPTYR